MSSQKADLLKSILMLLCLTLFALLSIIKQTPPREAPFNAAPSEFSAGRAMKHLEIIARRPHPIGSTEHAVVRNYILQEMTALGVTPEVQETTVVVKSWGMTFRAGKVRNIVAKLKGEDNRKALLLSGHYDSVPNGPGASDDGSAVAVMLETMRALKNGSPLKNDLIFLFTDGEEAGLLGAKAFVDEYPGAKDVGVVLNFEARGNSGPVIMFETSEQNGWLIDEFAQAAPHPTANSLAYEVYRILPNDTDLTVFKRAGLAGLNFAYIYGLTHYHSQIDNVENIDQRSLQHAGSCALALTHHFGNMNLEHSREKNAVYFDILGLTLVHYSEAWAILFTFLITLLFVGIIFLGWRQAQLSLREISLSVLAFFVSMFCALAVVVLVWWAISVLDSEFRAMPGGVTYNSVFYAASLVTLTIAVTSSLQIFFRQKLNTLNQALGAMLCWLILLLLTIPFLPGISYLLTWPMLFSLIGLLYVLSMKSRDLVIFRLLIVLSITAGLGLILIVPAIYLIVIALPLNLVGAIAIALLVSLQLGLLIPHLRLMAQPYKWFLPIAAITIFLAFVLIGSFTSGFDQHHPKRDIIFYGLNADTGKAIWASLDTKPDEWTTQFFSKGAKNGPLTEFFPLHPWKFLQSQAPVAPLSAPYINLLDEKKSDSGGRILHMRVGSTRQAPLISIYIDSDAECKAAEVNEKPINLGSMLDDTSHGNRWGLSYYALPLEGIDITVETKTAHPIKLMAVDVSYGLPELQTTALKARPNNMMAAPWPFSDSTMVSRSYTF